MEDKFSMERLSEAAASKGNVCVGLDTAPEYLPPASLAENPPAEAVLAYNKAIIDATLDAAACYKVQIAYYEELGLSGLRAYSATLAYIREKGGIAIADVKRGDIADTAARYARAHFAGDFEADIVTLNPYMGADSLEPWFLEARKKKKGAFVLLRTSNKGFSDFEGQKTERGSFVYDLVGEKLLEYAEKAGDSQYGVFGAVAGAEPKTHAEREEALSLRRRYEKLFFLIPGYGAQGGGAAEASLLLKRDKTGGVVNASRSILKAWTACRGAENAGTDFAADCARKAVLAMRDAIRAV
jgi:orotidine-5'-phosphate decarboxylase